MLCASIASRFITIESIGPRCPTSLFAACSFSGDAYEAIRLEPMTRRATALIADEPVSMADASLRMSIVNLLGDLRDSFGVTVI